MNPGFLAPLVGGSDGQFVIRNARTKAVVAERIETAFDSATRRKGLLGRDGLPEGSALVIAPSNAVHTFSMRFPIDVVFVRRSGVVSKVRHAMPCGRMSASLLSFAVIELPAGAAERAALNAGDCLEIVCAIRPEPH